MKRHRCEKAPVVAASRFDASPLLRKSTASRAPVAQLDRASDYGGRGSREKLINATEYDTDFGAELFSNVSRAKLFIQINRADEQSSQAI